MIHELVHAIESLVFGLFFSAELLHRSSFLFFFSNVERKREKMNATKVQLKRTGQLFYDYMQNERPYDFVIRHYVLDVPARDLIKCCIGHNGFASCEKCTVWRE